MELTEEQKEWIKKAIERNATRDRIKEDLQKAKYSIEGIEKMIAYYDEESKPKEKQKLSFFQKWKTRRFLKGIRNAVMKQRNYIEKLTKSQAKLTAKEEKELDDYKKSLIKGILGDKEKEKLGFIDIFEVKGEDGKDINEKYLMDCSIDDLMDLTEELINNLEKEV